MQKQPNIGAQTPFPIQELDQIDCAIQAMQRCLEKLNARREALISELERITRPQLLTTQPQPKLIGPGLQYRGIMFVRWNYIDIHIDLLRRLWNDFPDRRDAMAKAMSCHGSTRTYVAKTPSELFPGKATSWAQRYSRRLIDGWYVDTNLNRERMRRILPAAVRAAGLKWEEDVKVYWRAQQVTRP